MSQPPNFDFDANPDHVRDYDRNVRLFMPAYDASHAIASVILRETVPAGGHILAIGAGGGREVEVLAGHNPGWRFTLIDPSREMLAMARSRLGDDQRFTYVTGIATDAPDGPFDAATAFLALHFVVDDGARLAQLRAIHRRLRPGGAFLQINGMLDDDSEQEMARYAAHALLNGAAPEIVELASVQVRAVAHMLTEARERELLAGAGFSDVRRFLHALHMRGLEATA